MCRWGSCIIHRAFFHTTHRRLSSGANSHAFSFGVRAIRLLHASIHKGRIEARNEPKTTPFFTFMHRTVQLHRRQARASRARSLRSFPNTRRTSKPFAGGAQVFFRKEPSKVEVLNDLDGEIVNFYRVCQQHYEELCGTCASCVVSRTWFDLLQGDRSGDPDRHPARGAASVSLEELLCGPGPPPELQRARGRAAGLQSRTASRAHRRDAHTGWRASRSNACRMRRCSTGTTGPATLFYLDPPYYEPQTLPIQPRAGRVRKMAERLGSLQRQVRASLNDVPEVRAIFKNFTIRSVELAYTAQKIAGRRYHEVLITNF